MNSNTIKKNKFIPLIGINEECAGFCKNCCNSFKDSLAWCDHCISIKCKNNYSLFFNNNPKEPVSPPPLALEQKQGVHYSKEELTQYATEDINKTVESQLINEDIDKKLRHPSKLDEDFVKKLEFMYGIRGMKKSNSVIYSKYDNRVHNIQVPRIEVPRIEVPRIEVPRNRSRSPRRNNSKINHRITQQHIIRVPTEELAKVAIEAALDRGIYNIRVFVN
jgi:hypothetical protein